MTPAQKEQEFTFTVTLAGVPDGDLAVEIDGAPQTLTVTDGQIILTLRHGQTARIKALPVGSRYTVEETPQDGYIIVSNGHTGHITALGAAAAFTNIYGEPADGDTTLTVKKIVEGEIPEKDKNREFAFTVIIDGVQTPFTLKHNEEKTFVIPNGAVYEVIEEDYFPEGYLLSSVTNGAGTAAGGDIDCVFVNTFTGTVSIIIKGEKTWELNGQPDSVMPSSITVHLKAGTTTYRTATVTAGSDGKWAYTFIAPKFYQNTGEEIDYYVEEDTVPGFYPTVTGYDILNTYGQPETVSLKVTKAWYGDVESERPASIEVQLYKNGVAEGNPVTLDNTGGWTHTWQGLDRSAAWTVDEVTIPEGYQKRITGNIANGFTITNYIGPEPPDHETVTINGYKTWNHGDNDPSQHPKAIIVYVKSGDQILIQKQITAKEHWSWSFTMDKYDAQGNEIEYVIGEVMIPEYVTRIEGYDIINSHVTHEKITISGVKTWDHGGIEEQYKPKAITVQIMNGDTMAAEKSVTAADNWEYSFDLPKYNADGSVAIYSIREANVPYYTASYNGADIHNEYKGMDYPGDNPSTGDDIQLFLWIAVMTLSLACMSACIVIGHRQRKRYQSAHVRKR